MEKTLSVIVPVYNAQKYLRRCLDSLCNQSFKDLELILVDDGSEDSSPQICDEYAAKDSRVRVFHKENSGVSSARNLGLDEAKGKYIVFMDSDDYVSADMYENLISLIEKENTDIAICGYLNEETPNNFVPYCKEKINKIFNREEMIENLISNKYYSCSCCDKLFKREVIADTRFDTSITQYEDLMFIYSVMAKSQKAAFTSEAYYYYCTNKGSASTIAFNDSMMAIVEVSERILNDIEKNIPSLIPIAQKEFIRNNLMCAINAVNSNYKNKESIKIFKKNIRHYLKFYLKTNSSLGYKMSAILLSISWTLFKCFMKVYGRKG